MFSRSSGPRLPLKKALRTYWFYLMGLFLLQVLMVFVPAAVDRTSVFFGLFFAAAFSAGWPWLYRDAPYTFWVVACVYWVVGFALMVLVKAEIGRAHV